MLEDIGYIWRAPMRADRRDWLTAGAVIAGAGALLATDRRIDDWIVDHEHTAVIRALGPFRHETPILGKIATARGMVPISGVLLTAGLISDNRKLREAGWGCLSGWAFSNTIRYALYFTIARPRPSVANGDQYQFDVPGGDWNQHSFFGGHATNAFACVTFWNERFDLKVGEPLLYAVATANSLARMVDRHHWASDTFLGIAVGYATGRIVAGRYDRRQEEREIAGPAIPISALGLTLIPTTKRIVVGWQTTF